MSLVYVGRLLQATVCSQDKIVGIVQHEVSDAELSTDLDVVVSIDLRDFVAPADPVIQLVVGGELHVSTGIPTLTSWADGDDVSLTSAGSSSTCGAVVSSFSIGRVDMDVGLQVFAGPVFFQKTVTGGESCVR